MFDINDLPDNLPEIKREEVKFIYGAGYYDGPMSGMCLCNNEQMWFQSFDSEEYPRKFILFRLTNEQMISEEYNHSQFQKYVGNHMDYDENGERAIGDLKPQNMWNSYYSQQLDKKKLDLSQSEPVAIFFSTCNAAGVAFNQAIVENLSGEE